MPINSIRLELNFTAVDDAKIDAVELVGFILAGKNNKICIKHCI